MTRHRDKGHELQLLSAAEMTNALATGFASHAFGVLEADQQKHGNTSAALTARELLGALGNQIAFLAGWITLTAQAITDDDEIDGEARSEMFASLNPALGAAAPACGMLDVALREYDAARQRSGARGKP